MPGGGMALAFRVRKMNGESGGAKVAVRKS
jgi:hypothetical protein